MILCVRFRIEPSGTGGTGTLLPPLIDLLAEFTPSSRRPRPARPSPTCGARCATSAAAPPSSPR